MKPGARIRLSAFTLVECMVVIGIVAALVALALGAGFGGIRKSASSVKCVSNLKQLGTAIFLYAADHNGDLPAVTGDAAAESKDDRDGKGGQWDMQVTPYLAIRSNLGKTPQKDTPFFCPESEPDPSYLAKAVVPLSYTYNVHLGKFDSNPGIKLSGSVGQSSVMMLADLELSNSTPSHSFVPQTGQGRNNAIVFRPAAAYYKFLAYRHTGKLNILFLDGSVGQRVRLIEGDKASPPENVRWIPDGPLTGSR